jgi:peptidoglycan/LPS O-acetylase OafA/YrhL
MQTKLSDRSTNKKVNSTMTQRTTRTDGARKYLGLQILRITAAFLVLITHSMFYASQRLDKHFHYWKRGATGVDIFFVLSGFVMIYSSTKLMNNPDGWRIFAERRIIRIVPMYWIATSIKVIAILFTTGYVLHAQFSLANTLKSYFFLPSINIDGEFRPVLGVGWTLNFEMLFYSLFALSLFLRLNVYKFVGTVLGLLTLGAFFRKPNWPTASFYLDTATIEFFYGMLIAKLCLANKHIPRNVAIPLLGVGFLGLLTPMLHWEIAQLIPQGMAAALVVLSMASLEDCLTRIPGFVLYMAEASYVIYLFHPLIAPAVPVVLMKLHLVYPWLSVACSVSLALAGGCLVHLVVEEPTTKWFRDNLLIGKKKIIHKITAT